MPTHLCVNGRSVEYEPTPAEAKFLRRVEAMLEDTKVTDLEVRGVIYGPDNPLLAQVHGYTFVTPEAFEHPVFRVLQDLHDRKRVATGALDLERAAARYTMTVAQAAEQLGLGESAIRMAVRASRLPSWMKGGEIFLDPQAVAAYKGGARRGGPATKLLVAIGSHDGTSLRLRVDGGSAELEHARKAGGITSGELTKWSVAEVITGARRGEATTYRYWKITPGGNQERIELGELKVVGRFTIVERKNGKAASDAWYEGKRNVARPAAEE
jgi:excisionase family DNA binding protein